MQLEDCRENFNMMYEWTYGNAGEWYPCHVLTDERNLDWPVVNCTRNGSISIEPIHNVRKMGMKRYLENRKEVIELYEESSYKWYGYHKDIEEDLKLFEQSNDLEMYRYKS